MNSFYEKAEIINSLKSKVRPTINDCEQLLQTIQGDEELTVHFYKANTNPAWIRLLKDVGEFKSLGGSDEEVGVCQEAQARYLANVAKQSPEEVLKIFTSFKNLHEYVRGEFVNALLSMPNKKAVKGVEIVLGYISGKEKKEWYFVCYRTTELMVKLAGEYPDKAFAIAKELLEVWVPEKEKGKFIQKKIEAKFRAFEYENIIFKFYSKLWEADAIKATKLLIDIFNSYLEELQKDKDYEVSNLMYISLERLDQIGERYSRDILASLIGAICQAGKMVIENQAERTNKLLKLIQKYDRQIFRRIEMYLLRFVPAGTQKKRISEIISNKDYRKDTGYKYEYYMLLKDKFDDISEYAKEIFIKWIEAQKVDNEDDFGEWFEKVNERKHTPEDLEKYENRIRASKLYLVREKFRELYEKYRKKAEATDIDLMPRPRVGGVRAVSPIEGSPLTVEQMVEMGREQVLEYLQKQKNYEGGIKPSQWREPQYALGAAFKETMKQQPGDYIDEALRDGLKKLNENFLSDYFSGIRDLIRSNEWKKEYWGAVIGLAYYVVKENKDKKEYKQCFSDILSVLRDGFTEDNKTIEFDNRNIKTLWFILETLMKYNEDYKTSSYESDPIQMRCTSVNGEALEQVVMLGIVCKKDFTEYYKKHLKSGIRKLLDYVVKDVKRAEVNCTLGIDLGRIGWIDEEWLRDNVEKIFVGEMWDVVWGTYVSWGRPSRPGFELLTDKGIYKDAIMRLGKPKPKGKGYDFRKDPEEGLVEHLMIGFFNGWVEFDNEPLRSFFSNASSKLRGYAASFLTTGFKSVNEDGGEQKEKVAKRMKEYWEKRLAVITKEPEENIDETQEFASWAKDSLLSKKETLNLLYETLKLSEGKIGERVYSVEFIEGICDAAKGNEIKAIQCLKKAFNNPEMRMYSQSYKKSLDTFFDLIIKLEDDYPDIGNIRKEAIVLVDTIGRLCRDLRDDYIKLYTALNKKIKQEKKIL